MTIKKSSIMRLTPVDVEAQNEGTWTEYNGVMLKIGRSTNPIFKRAMVNQQSNNKGNEGADFDTREAASIRMLAEAMSEGLLFDWAGYPGEVPYSKENAKELLMIDEDCRAFVLNYSNEISNFHKTKVRKTLEK